MATTRPIRAGRAFAFAGRLVDLVLLGVIALGLTAVLFGRALPAVGHPVFVVSGPSMVPALPVGTAVALDAVDPARLQVGDVVSLQTGPDRAVFTHRIIRIVDRDDGRWIETKGDANPHPDPARDSLRSLQGRTPARRGSDHRAVRAESGVAAAVLPVRSARAPGQARPVSDERPTRRATGGDHRRDPGARLPPRRGRGRRAWPGSACPPESDPDRRPARPQNGNASPGPCAGT